MKNKTLITIASFCLSLSVVFLVVLVFFGDRIDEIDSLLTKEETESTCIITERTTETTTKETTTVFFEETTELTTEITVLPPPKPMYSGVDDKIVAFTFDDGPSKNVTPKILDTLDRYGGRATFFVLGNTVYGKTYIFDRMRALGCQIGNHSYSHKDFEELDADGIKAEFELSQNAIEEASGIRPELFRVPYGDKTPLILSSIEVPLVYWSIDTLDWSKKDKPNVHRSEEERKAAIDSIVDSVLNYVVPGDIVLMHDLYDVTAEAFEIIAKSLTEDGWELVTVSEMYEARGYSLRAGIANRCAR